MKVISVVRVASVYDKEVLEFDVRVQRAIEEKGKAANWVLTARQVYECVCVRASFSQKVSAGQLTTRAK